MKSKLWLILIPLGLIARAFTDILDPVHEHMHIEAIALTGGRVVSQSWSSVSSVTSHYGFVAFMGYHGELWLYAILALLCKRIGLFAYGALLTVGILAVPSHDFAHLPEWCMAVHLIIWFVVTLGVSVWIYRRMKRPADQAGLSSDLNSRSAVRQATR